MPDKEESFLESCTTKDDFSSKYSAHCSDDIKYRQLLFEIFSYLKKSVANNDFKAFKRLCDILGYMNDSKSLSETTFDYDEKHNPIWNVSIILEICKFERIKILKYALKNYKVICEAFSNPDSILLPDEQNEISHNAFYYCIRSGNIELLEALINELPDNYFTHHPEDLDTSLSQAYQELKLKNIVVTQNIEVYVQEKLIDLRFFSQNSSSLSKDENLLDHIERRIEFFTENIDLLNSVNEENQKFIVVSKQISQDVHILKRQLKYTYDKLPWEEIEFCLLSFISSRTKIQEINLYYQATLNRNRIIKHLNNFAQQLNQVKLDIKNADTTKLDILPKTNRNDNIAQIMLKYPQFKELYDDYHEIRDIHSLERINQYIILAISVDPSKKEGQLVIVRSLQVIGEYLKNTLESPKLSTMMNERILLLLSKETRKIIIDLRNSLSHAYSLSKRISIEESYNITFFVNVQNDVQKIGEVINDVLVKNKMITVKNLLQKFIDSESLNEIKDISEIIQNYKLYETVSFQDYTNENYERLKKLIESLKSMIADLTEHEKNMLNVMTTAIKEEKRKAMNVKKDFLIKSSFLKSLNVSLNNTNVDKDAIRSLKYMASSILKDVKVDKTYSLKLEHFSHFLLVIAKNKSQQQLEKSDEISRVVHEIFCIVKFGVGNVKWIIDLASKLKTDDTYVHDQHSPTNNAKNSYDKHLAYKLCELQKILDTHTLNDPQKITLFRNERQLQAVLEMLILDILSILGSFKNRLENNFQFLDDYASVLIGKSLRNHLAHDNLMIDILQSDPSIALLSNAKKLVAEDVIKNKQKIGKKPNKSISDVRKTFQRELQIIDIQEKMFETLEKGSIELLATYIKKGADIFARRINLSTSLHCAVKSNNIEIVEFVLSQGVKLNVKDVNSRSPLHTAAASGSDKVLEFLLEHYKGLNVNETDDIGKTPLHIAAQNGYKLSVESLLKYKAKNNILDARGCYPIYYAIENNHIKVVETFLKNEPSTIKLKNGSGFTLLHMAAERGHSELVDLLIKRKINVQAVTDAKTTALHLAALNGHLQVVESLISKGSNVNARNSDGCTPLHYAVENGHEKVAETLLNRKADPNIFDTELLNTPLHYSAMDGYESIAKILLKHGANPNSITHVGMTPLTFAAGKGHLKVIDVLLEFGVNVKDRRNGTALHYAIQGGHYDIVELLLKHKTDVNKQAGKIFEDMTPAHVAVSCDRADILQLLVRNGAKLHIRDDDGCMPLHLAAQNGSEDVVKILLDNKCEVNAKTLKNNLSPILIAAQNGKTQVVEVLLKYNADINAKSSLGLTPLIAAIMSGHKDTAELLIKCEANINAKDFEGMTALHAACEFGHKELVELLIEKGASIGIKSNLNTTPLVHAVNHNYTNIVEILIKNGVDVNADGGLALLQAVKLKHKDMVNVLLKNKATVTEKILVGSTLLHFAVCTTNPEIVSTLIKHGANVNSNETKECQTPLFMAVISNNDQMVKILLKNGANINCRIKDGSTPLHMAVTQENSSSIVETLLKHKADVNIKDNKNRKPFELAVAHNRLENVQILMKYTKININERISDDWYILHLAAQEGNVEMTEYLLSCGADMHAKNKSGSQPIHIASRDGFKSLVEYFIDRGCSVNELGCANQTPLHYAAVSGHKDVSIYLIKKGANINAKDRNGHTPLHFAAAKSTAAFVKFMLECGAIYNLVNNMNCLPVNLSLDKEIIVLLTSTEQLFAAVKKNNVEEVRNCVHSGAFVNAKDSVNVTPLFHAVEKGYQEIVDILLKSSANPNLKGIKGLSALHYAAKFSRLDMIKSLLAHGAIYNIKSDSGKTPLRVAKDSNTIAFLQSIHDLFEKTKNGNLDMDNLKNIKNMDTLGAIQGTMNMENKKLVDLAIQHNFPEIEKLKEFFRHISITSQKNKKAKKPSQNQLVKNEKALIKSEFDSKVHKIVMEEMETKFLNDANQAEQFSSEGKYEEASKLYSKILIKMKEILGPNHLNVLDIENRITKTLYMQDKYEEAYSLLEKIYTERVKVLGQNDESALSARGEMALVLYHQDKNEEALEIFEVVCKKQKQILKPDDPELLITLGHKALVLDALGRHEEGLLLQKEVYEMRKKYLGPYHPTTIVAQNNVAVTLLNAKAYDEALNAFSELYALKKKTLGSFHIETLRVLYGTADILAKMEKYDESLNTYKNLLEIQKSSLGSSHMDTLTTQQSIANLFFQQEKYTEAKETFEQCLEEQKVILGPDHPNIAAIEERLTEINFKLKYQSIFNAVNKTPSEALMKKALVAIKKGDITAIKEYIESGIMKINHQDDDGRTLLHFAVDSGDVAVINLLLEKGIDATLVTKKGNTPLHTTISKNRQDIAEVLLKNFTGDKLRAFVNAQTSGTGTSSIHLAAKNGHYGLVRLLLRKGAVYDIKNHDSKTPIDLSTDSNVTDTLRLIHESFDRCQQGDVEALNNLKKMQGDEFNIIANVRNDQGKTLVQIAKEEFAVELLAKLKKSD